MNDISFNSSSSSSTSTSASSSTTNSLNRSLVINTTSVCGSSSIIATPSPFGVKQRLRRSRSLVFIKQIDLHDELQHHHESPTGGCYQYLENCQTPITPVTHRQSQRQSQLVPTSGGSGGDELSSNHSCHQRQYCLDDDYLLSEIFNLKKDLKVKDTEVDKLNDIRERLESEIRDLTAVLFEQAYEMVNKAKEETAQQVKLLHEANGKIHILEAELNALKVLINASNNTGNGSIMNSTMTAGTTTTATTHFLGHLHSPSHHHTHKRTTSHTTNLIQPSSSSQLSIFNNNNQQQQLIHEIDPIYFKEIVLWRENPLFDLNNLFYSRVYNEDILPCINFNNKELVEQLMESIKTNNVCIEDISKSHPIETMQICSLTNIPSICQYKIKFSCSDTQWYLISKLCRNRIISVCDFFIYLKYIKDGLVKAENRDVYWTIIDLRKKMSLSRLGI